MPNRYQVAYIASFVVTFASLLAFTRFVNSKLNAAGYYVSDLILIGLPRKDHMDSSNSTSPSPASFLGNSSGQLIAFALAVATSAFIYLKFGKAPSELSGIGFTSRASTKNTVLERKPVLDPQVWQEFPLKEKISISPNTAM